VQQALLVVNLTISEWMQAGLLLLDLHLWNNYEHVSVAKHVLLMDTLAIIFQVKTGSSFMTHVEQQEKRILDDYLGEA
jgi:hypothetical protein